MGRTPAKKLRQGRRDALPALPARQLHLQAPEQGLPPARASGALGSRQQDTPRQRGGP